jgi:sugar lactone lactonase YvrE
VSRPAAFAATAVVVASLVTGLTPGTSAVALAPALAPGTMVTVAGGLGAGPARSVGQRPAGLAQYGNTLYVADSGAKYYASVQVEDVVRAIDLTTGVERVVAGTGQFGFSGDGGPATAAKLADPSALAVDTTGNLYIGDAANWRVRKVDTAGVITTFAGGALVDRGSQGDGGPATEAQLSVAGMAFDRDGNLYVADSYRGRVRRIDPSGTITTFAGGGAEGADGDVGDGGPATAAHLDSPVDVAADAAGRIYIADSVGERVRRVVLQATLSAAVLDAVDRGALHARRHLGVRRDDVPRLERRLAGRPGGVDVADVVGDRVHPGAVDVERRVRTRDRAEHGHQAPPCIAVRSRPYLLLSASTMSW